MSWWNLIPIFHPYIWAGAVCVLTLSIQFFPLKFVFCKQARRSQHWQFLCRQTQSKFILQQLDNILGSVKDIVEPSMRLPFQLHPQLIYFVPVRLMVQLEHGILEALNRFDMIWTVNERLIFLLCSSLTLKQANFSCAKYGLFNSFNAFFPACNCHGLKCYITYLSCSIWSLFFFFQLLESVVMHLNIPFSWTMLLLWNLIFTYDTSSPSNKSPKLHSTYNCYGTLVKRIYNIYWTLCIIK